MVSLNRQSDYALQFIAALALLQDGETLSLRVFAQESGISFTFLQRIARQLKHAGIVVASKGAHGGYTLARSAEKISAYDIVSAIEGRKAIASCITQPGSCALETVCKGKGIVETLNFEIAELLRSVKASDFELA